MYIERPDRISGLVLPNAVSRQSGRKLAEVLGVPVLTTFRNTARALREGTVINFGNPFFAGSLWSDPDSVNRCINKNFTFMTLHGRDVPCVESTAHFDDALEWQRSGASVVVRESSTAHDGIGMRIIKPDEELPDAGLYTKYFKKRREYRVHCLGGMAVAWYYKAKKAGFEQASDQIRTTANGWGFNTLRNPTPRLTQLAEQAAEAIGANICAVDILWNEYHDKYVVCEINSAPELLPSTLEAYRNFFLG